MPPHHPQSELRVPIGIQGLPAIVAANRRYIDKTPYITSWLLNGQGSTNIIHRPRRFGKTLTLSVIEALYSHSKDLFKDTSLPESFWNKFPAHPVISFTMAVGVGDQAVELMKFYIQSELINEMRRLNIFQLGDETIPVEKLLSVMIDRLIDRDPHHLPVILIDEYDSLVTRAYERGENLCEAAQQVSQYIFPLKYKYKQIHASYVIGIMKYQGLNLMSTVNNPEDVTLDPNYAQMIGFTMEEIQTYFPKELEEIALCHEMSVEETLQKIKTYYNGYCFSPKAIGKTVYAGYSFCKFAWQAKYFGDFWYSTGGINTLYHHGKAQIDEIDSLIKNGGIATASLIDLDGGHNSKISNQINLPSFLFYHGYLTIQSFHFPNQLRLAIPNDEVRRGLHRSYAVNILKIKPTTLKRNIALLELYVEKQDVEALVYLFAHVISGIPGTRHEPSEAYYQSIILTFLFCCYPIEVHAEQPLATGIPDIVIQLSKMTYLFELKFVGKHTDEKPLIAALHAAKDQVKAKRYLEFYRNGFPLYAVALVVSQNDHNLVGYMLLESPSAHPLANTIEVPVLFTDEKIKEMGIKRVGIPPLLLPGEDDEEKDDGEEEPDESQTVHQIRLTDPIAIQLEPTHREHELEKRAIIAESIVDLERAKTKAEMEKQEIQMQMKLIFILKKQNLPSEEICRAVGMTAEQWEQMTGEKLNLD